MTKEQWLVYIWSIYPQGGYQMFWSVSLIISVGFIAILYAVYTVDYDNNSAWIKLGKWKLFPLFFLVMAFLSNFVPSRDNFMYIVATPYVVDSGKSLIDSLQDENSKLYKINQIMDKSLEKVLKNLNEEEKENKK